MASLSSKRLASANEKTLNDLHILSIAINALTLISLFAFGRPKNKWIYMVFSAPSFALQYLLERFGRPIYNTDRSNGHRTLIKSGDEINNTGLYEYMFDMIYITWLCDILMLCFGSNYVWLLLLIIPAFAGYKVFGFARPFLLGFTSRTAKKLEVATQEQAQSRRQAKLEKKEQKGQRIRQR